MTAIGLGLKFVIPVALMGVVLYLVVRRGARWFDQF